MSEDGAASQLFMASDEFLLPLQVKKANLVLMMMSLKICLT